MFLRIKELCQRTQQNQQQQQSLQIRDNLATTIFGQTADDNFVLSNQQPKTIHKVEVDKTINYIYDLDYKDNALSGFEKLGPNEKYVVHKIFHSHNKLICIVGGIGVGKTSFSKYLIDTLIPKVFHLDEQENHRCPGVVYFNFNAYNNVTFPKDTVEIAEKSFVKLLSSSIKDALVRGKFFNINEQVGIVWNELMNNPLYRKNNNTAISELRSKLDEEDLDEARFLQNPDEVIGQRKEIRKEIVNSENSLDYFAALLNYVKQKFYDIKTPCLLIIIDNVDRELPEIQRIVEKIIRSFAEQCDVKVIFNIRQTTYHQGTIDKFSALVDRVPYNGPIPLEVIYSRIDNFVNKGIIYENCLEKYTKEGIDALTEKLKFIKENFLVTERFTTFFESLCGRSVRKGLMIAQNLILNSVYNPLEIPTERDKHLKSVEGKELRTGDLLRALLVRTNETFEYGGVIENVFQTQAEKNTSHFIKLRILKATRRTGTDGIRIGRLVAALRDFGYSEDLIIDSLDEMLIHLKRLIWTDTSSTTDESSQYLIKHKENARIFLNSIGEGYINILYKNVDYIQEIMMDTSVEISRFGVGWNDQSMLDRLTLLLRFCEYLQIKEEIELKEYFNKCNPNDYERIFGDRNLISHEILETVSKDVKAILDFVINNSKGDYHQSVKLFEESQSGMYYLRIQEAKKFQQQWFGI